jgi:hypothetical protein
MLTDRQNKIKQEIQSLLLISSPATVGERKYLKEAAESLERQNVDFKRIINKLTLNLEALDRYETGGLTVPVKTLLQELVSIYGEPENGQGTDVDWQIKDPDYVFIGGFNGWVKRGGKKTSVFIQVLRAFIAAAVVLSILYGLLPLMRAKMGKNYELGVVVLGVIIIIILVFGGRLRRKDKDN